MPGKIAAPAEIDSGQRQSDKQQDPVTEALHHPEIPRPDLTVFEHCTYCWLVDQLINNEEDDVAECPRGPVLIVVHYQSKSGELSTE
jgi:hypothetical protein